MGRQLKRVALDFDHPVGEAWPGYINPHGVDCGVCRGAGETAAARRLSDLVNLLMMSGSDSLDGRCHPYFQNMPLHHTRGVACGPDMAELTGALAGRAPRRPFGHDAVDRWTAARKIVEAAGLDPKVWGQCPACEGEGSDPACREAYEAWTATEPPAGEGYQLWENVSEGSPISPVFKTADALAHYLATHDVWGSHESSAETWLKFIEGPGYAPSLVADGQGVRSGVEAMAELPRG